MAFRDITQYFYNDTVRIDYKDAAHRYYRRERITTELPAENDLAWGKSIPVKGVTTMMDAVLEKKGLMTWPMGLALRELTGFYDFKNEEGEQLTGFSKGVGTLWEVLEARAIADRDLVLKHFLDASKAWQRKKKKGADIGSVVHDAIEHYVKDQPFDILETYTLSVMSAEYESEEAKALAISHIVDDVSQAQQAFDQFVIWWTDKQPKLLGAEALVYSKELDYCGTFDGLIELDNKIVLCDWKTSNASTSKDAAAPQGVYYSYFIQSAAYAHAWAEMGNGKVDDLLIVSARKDGGFDTVSASQLGLTVDDCIDWWKAVAICHKFATKTKNGLLENVKVKEEV